MHMHRMHVHMYTQAVAHTQKLYIIKLIFLIIKTEQKWKLISA